MFNQSLKFFMPRWRALNRGCLMLLYARFRQLYGPVQAACLLLASCVTVVAAQLVQQSQAGHRITAVDSELCEDMKARHVLGPDGPVSCSRLRLVRFSYIDFDDKLHDDGEVVVMDAAARNVLNIFNALREIRFPIAKARLVNSYDGNDDSSMDDNNTSAFNSRKITGGTSISLHAYGLAIDINPIQNPYLKRVNGYVDVSPPAGGEYTNRADKRPGMAESIIDIFADNGFLIWGGSWNDPVDYQHFQTGRKMAERLSIVSRTEAEGIFAQMVERYRACRKAASDKELSSHKKCIVAADPTAR
jgi:hypothetical protein